MVFSARFRRIRSVEIYPSQPRTQVRGGKRSPDGLASVAATRISQIHQLDTGEHSTCGASALCGLCTSASCVARNSAIARFVRQTRTITYEKSENLSHAAIALTRFSSARVRQTRTRSVTDESVLLDK